MAEVHAYVAEIFNNNVCPAIQVGGTANLLAGGLWRIQREQ
jgi:hypothetical protein